MLRRQGRLLSIQVLTALLVMGLHGQSENSRVDFAVTSVKPTAPANENHLHLDFCRPDGSFAVAGAPILWSLKYAFNQPEYAIADAPPWLSDFASAYDIEAKPDAVGDNAQCRAMLRSLFSERFHLLTHHEKRLTSVYFLRPVQKGPKLKPGGGVHLNHSTQFNDGGTPQWPDGWTMPRLATFLSGVVERPVVDQTGLSGTYGITLDYSHGDNDDRPDIFTAVQEQLGLKLFSGKAPVDMLIVDHIQKPEPN